MTEQPNLGPSDPEPPQRVGLDLIAPELYAPMLRRMIGVAAAAGLVVALLLGVLVSWPVAVLAAVILGVPTALYAVSAQRRRMWLVGNVIEVRTMIGSRRLDLADANGVELAVYPGRLSRIVLRVTVERSVQVVPLAMYTDAGSGRELHILGLRRLADALTTGTLAAALPISSLLIGQLRAEARDAGLEERPLYRAVQLVRAKDTVAPVVLSDREIATLE